MLTSNSLMKRNPRFQKIDIFIAVFFFIFLTAIITSISQEIYYQSQLDSAQFVDVLSRIKEYGFPYSQINWSVNYALETVVIQPPEQVCSSSLKMDNVHLNNLLERHAYLLLFPLSLVSYLLDELLTVSLFHALGFSGMLVTVFWYMRNRGISIIPTIVMISAVILHPAWGVSVFGQFYPDRIFLVTGSLYLFFVFDWVKHGKDRIGAIYLIALLSCLNHERSAFMIGIVSISLPLLYGNPKNILKLKNLDRPTQHLFQIGIASGIYVVLYMALFQKNGDYQGLFETLLTIIERYKTSYHQTILMKFLLVNLPFLVLAFFERRLFVLVIIAMIPNIILSNGGAEKIGWITHYHTMYFPLLVVAATVGLTNIFLKFKSNKKNSAWTICIGIGLLTIMATFDPHSTSPLFKLDAKLTHSTAPWRMAQYVSDQKPKMGVFIGNHVYKPLSTQLPNNSVIVTTENFMPSLVNKERVLHYYPIGLASAEYAVLSYTKTPNSDLSFGNAYTYFQQPNSFEKLNSCLNVRLKEEGYYVEKTIQLSADNSSGIAILRR